MTIAEGTLDQKVAKLLQGMKQGFDPVIGSALALFQLQNAPPRPLPGWLWFLKSTNRFQARVLETTLDVPLILSRTTGLVNVVDTTVDTNIVSFTVPGGTLHSDRMLRVTIVGRYLNNSGAGDTFAISTEYDGTGWTDTTPSIAANANRYHVKMVVYLTAGNATGTQRMFTDVTVGNVAAATAGFGDIGTALVVNAFGHRNMTKDSTGDLTFSVSIQHTTANANISFIRDMYIAEIL